MVTTSATLPPTEAAAAAATVIIAIYIKFILLIIFLLIDLSRIYLTAALQLDFEMPTEVNGLLLLLLISAGVEEA